MGNFLHGSCQVSQVSLQLPHSYQLNLMWIPVCAHGPPRSALTRPRSALTRPCSAAVEEAAQLRISSPCQGFPVWAERGCRRPAQEGSVWVAQSHAFRCHGSDVPPCRSAMCEAVLVDLIHGCSPACTGASPPEDCAASDPHVFLLCGESLRDKSSLSCVTSACKNVRVLDSGSIAECLYRFKQTVDELDLSSVRVLTTPQGRDVLRVYQEQLFTAVYNFDYKVSDVTCPSCRGSAHTDSPGERVHEKVSAFLQQLPALKGDVTVLKSTLIPDGFGHGFSTRTGGVSYIPTLSSLNLFSSSRRRDARAVVQENRRRLALHAGFDPESLRLVKVNHASDVWVLGKAEPESYDAMVTDQPGVVLAAPGADCMPILFADPVSKVIGAAHAGWKGTLMGVAMATVEAMVTEFGCHVSDIVVAVGPSVGACCFTLERDQALDFHCIHPDCVPDPESAHPHVNIRLANRILLQNGGVLPENIHDDTVTERPRVTPCTSCHPEDFFSHRRDGLNFGTQVGFLWIKSMAGRTGPSTGGAV